jgi:hypothetical protein
MHLIDMILEENFFTHKAFICSNVKSHVGLPKHNQIACCTNANDVMSSISRLHNRKLRNICQLKPTNIFMKTMNLVSIHRLIDENPEECNSDKYNKPYSSVPRNISIYSSVTCSRQIYAMYILRLHITNEHTRQLALPHAMATCPLCSTVNRGTYTYTFLI